MKLTKHLPAGQSSFKQLPEKLLLTGCNIIDPGQEQDKRADILIENGVIRAIDSIDSSGFDGEVIDAAELVVSPGWMDMHVHLREPGREDEETIQSGTFAAANGGFTSICCMPNTSPTIDTQEIIQYIKDRARHSLVAVHPVAAITKQRKGEELAEILELVEQGAVAISDDTNSLMSAEIMRRALEYSTMVAVPVIGVMEDASMTEHGHINESFVSTCLGIGGLPSVAEEIMIARDIMLAEYTGGHLHVGHITSRRGINLVREAKSRGIRVTAEVTPHHFTLTEDAVRTFDTNTKVRPPLRSEDDRQAILEGLRDNTIDVIASDHSPHSWEEKAAEYLSAPFGIVGLESSLGLAIKELLVTGVLDMTGLIEKVALNPYRILGMTPPAIRPGQQANLTLFNPDKKWTLDTRRTLSRSSNTPFHGSELVGKPWGVINNNQWFRSIL